MVTEVARIVLRGHARYDRQAISRGPLPSQQRPMQPLNLRHVFAMVVLAAAGAGSCLLDPQPEPPGNSGFDNGGSGGSQGGSGGSAGSDMNGASDGGLIG